MFKQFLIMASVSAISLSAFAIGGDEIQNSIPLKDGSTVYIFKDGKMAMADKWGRATSMKQGQVMEAVDGQKINMQGNEVARLDIALRPNTGI
ncbi:MAG: periplasmic Cu(I)/Cu(II)-binding protein CopK [Sterolibacterium sp.]